MAEVTLDFDQITPRMLVEFKEKTGVELMSLADEAGEFDVSKMDSLVLAGCVWVALRTSGQSEATWEQALDTPLTQLSFAGGGDDGEDPTNASDAT